MRVTKSKRFYNDCVIRNIHTLTKCIALNDNFSGVDKFNNWELKIIKLAIRNKKAGLQLGN